MTVQSVSIIIPTYNRAAVLRITLETLAALALPDGWSGEVLVVDNCSPDDTAAVVEELRGRLALPLRRIVEDRQGAGHARNRGIEESSGDWLIFLDDDIKIAPGWLQAFADAVESFNPDAVVGPVFPWFEGDVPSWCAGRVLDSITSAFSRRGERDLVLPPAHAHEVCSANFAVRRSMACELGGFHPGLDRMGEGMLGGGDTEFAMRLADGGARTVYAAECVVEHLISQVKMSRRGLQERWRGLGMTAKALRRIRGETIGWWQQCRLFVRMHRFRWRARRLAACSPDAAFRWELEALRLHGLLFGRIDGVTSVRQG